MSSDGVLVMVIGWSGMTAQRLAELRFFSEGASRAVSGMTLKQPQAGDIIKVLGREKRDRKIIPLRVGVAGH